MTARPSDPVRSTLLTAGVGLTAALLMGLALSVFGKAPDFAGRAAAVESEGARAAALLKGAGRDTPAPPGALCRGPAPEAARRLREAIAAQATQAGLSADQLDVAPDDAGAPPTPLRIRLTATGSYDGAIALLANLAKARPQVFADSVDLTPKVSNVTLAFSGRAFCEG